VVTYVARGLEAMRGFGWDVPHYYLPMWYPHNWQTIRNAVLTAKNCFTQKINDKIMECLSEARTSDGEED
jgi:hypothetical protein